MAVRSTTWARVVRRVAMVVFGLGLIVYPDAGVVGGLTYLLLSRDRRPWPWPLPFVTIGVAVVLASLVSSWPLQSLAGAGMVWILGLAIYFVSKRVARRDLPYLVAGIGAGAVVLGALGGYQLVMERAPQSSVFAFHPNVTAALALAALWGSLGGVSLMHRVVGRGLLSVAAVFALAGLVFTASRSGLLGLAASVVVALVVVMLRSPRGRRVGLAVLGVLALVVAGGLWLGRDSESVQNLVVNASFESGAAGWRLGAESRVVSEGAVGGSSVELVREQQGWEVLAGLLSPVRAEEDTPYVLSFSVWPEPEGPPVIARIEAHDARGRFLGRAGRDGWTTGDESRAGGRQFLPTSPDGAWQRVEMPLPPTPPGTSELSVAFATDAAATGTYGLIDAVQLGRGSAATAFVEGPEPGILAYLGSLSPRLAALRDPVAASGGRIPMWRYSLQLAAAKPVLGYGFGVVDELVRPQAPRFVADPLEHPHSLYLQLLLQGGSLTLIAILMFLALVSARLARNAWSASWSATAALALLVGMLVMNVFDPLLTHAPVMGLFWLVILVGLVGGSDVTSSAQGGIRGGGQR